MDILYVRHLHQAEQLYSCGKVNTRPFSAPLCVGVIDCAPSFYAGVDSADVSNRCTIVSAYLKLYAVTIGSRLKTLSVKYSYSHKPKKEPETLYTFVFPAP